MFLGSLFSSINLCIYSFTNTIVSSLLQVYSMSCGEGDGTPLQYSCLENPMDGGAWQAAVHGVRKSQTQLSDFTFTFMHWRRKWQPPPVFLPRESQGRRNLVGCRLKCCTESDTAEATQQHVLKQGSISPPTLFFFNIVLTLKNIFLLYTNFRIISCYEQHDLQRLFF